MGKSQWEDAADGSSKRRSESSQKADKEGKKKKKKKRSVQDHTEAAVAGDAEPAAAAAVVPPAADGMQPDREPEEALDAAAGSHDADAPNSQQEGGKAGAAAASAQAAVAGAVAGGGKPAPVLPWMRVPVAIDAADGTPLDQVRGMDPRLRAALQGEPQPPCRGGAGALRYSKHYSASPLLVAAMHRLPPSWLTL
jgi:ATP-dependent RNA helicase DDX51/DBP6